MAREIIIDIDAKGNTTIKTTGFAGSECLRETADLERALGVKESDVKTTEFNRSAAQGSTAKAGR